MAEPFEFCHLCGADVKVCALCKVAPCRHRRAWCESCLDRLAEPPPSLSAPASQGYRR